MRKQTKLVAVLSAAALLAIGASMTSFAATKGWAQEGDTWVYLDSNGDRVTEDWKKSGANYYWLDENGEMAKNMIVEDDDNIYYVNEDGVRVVNQWVSVENTDADQVDGKDVDVLWYYLGSSGRAYKATGTNLFKIATINGGKYFFDSEGRMVSGWTYNPTTGSNEDIYYLGEENEGWARTGWQYLEIDEDIVGNYDDDEAWFNFNSAGKARRNTRTYLSNAYYSFDEWGVMVDDWQVGTSDGTRIATYSDIDLDTDSRSFYDIETGNQRSGWVYTYEDADESGDEKWFYLVSSDNNQAFNANGKDSFANGATAQKYVNGNETDGDPKAKVAAKVIKGKTYLFDNKGRMLTGVYFFNGQIKRDGGAGHLNAGVYYFNKSGGSAEGRMETGRTVINYDGENYTYYFNANGSAILLATKDGCLYDGNGVRVEAKDGNANQAYDIRDLGGGYVVNINGKNYTDGTIIVSSSGKVRTGTVTIDDVKYEIKNSVVTKAYNKDDKDQNNISSRYTPAVEVTKVFNNNSWAAEEVSIGGTKYHVNWTQNSSGEWLGTVTVGNVTYEFGW